MTTAGSPGYPCSTALGRASLFSAEWEKCSVKRNKGHLSRHARMHFPIATMKFHALAQYGVSTPFSLSVMLVGYQLICVSNLTHFWHFITNNFYMGSQDQNIWHRPSVKKDPSKLCDPKSFHCSVSGISGLWQTVLQRICSVLQHGPVVGLY